ncbi:Ankyrin repeats (3 copies)/Ankyrin repeats (many copies)/Ankyrin repeat [Novymonas esmeraldas]|uniref:Ankyrin repeats (3 copies)/Ankyrin repeats (Many copies)/Ankyrin repeat n=1 Tax=Novymonas esmeraldas TaxID=1808958 RepID=A0AAW0F2S5_9TRYP
MNLGMSSEFRHVFQLLLSPLEDPLRRYLDVCDDVHSRDPSRNTMLHWAAAVGNVTAADMLLRHGVEVDARNVYGATALHIAAAFGPNVGAMAPLLIQYGASASATLSARNPTTAETLLTARGMRDVWAWLSELVTLLQRRSDGHAPAVFRSSGVSAAPTSAAIHAVTPLLCAPEELRQLTQYRPADTYHAAATAAAGAQTVRVPRPPGRRISAHDGAGSQPTRQPQRASLMSVSPSSSVDAAAAAAQQRDAARARETAVALLVSREQTGRTLLEKEQVEAFMEVYRRLLPLCWSMHAAGAARRKEASRKVDGAETFSVWSSSSSSPHAQTDGSVAGEAAYAGLTGCIAAVLGERYDANGRRHLFVRLTGPRTSTTGSPATATSPAGKHESGAEMWCPLSAVSSDPVVVAYIERYSRTYTLTSTSAASAAATPSILAGPAGFGSPLDTMEREQLEAQLRMLPRRDLSNQESFSSLNVFARSPHPPVTGAARAAPERDAPQQTAAADLLSPMPAAPAAAATAAATAVLPHSDANSDSVAHTPAAFALSLPPMPSNVDDGDARRSWRFAHGSPSDHKAAANQWSATAPPVPSQTTLSQRSPRSQETAAAPKLVSGAPGPAARHPISLESIVQLHQRSSDDANGGHSGASSSVHTQAPQNSSLFDSASASPNNHSRHRLSATQKAKYNSFLRDSALQRLQKRQ